MPQGRPDPAGRPAEGGPATGLAPSEGRTGVAEGERRFRQLADAMPQVAWINDTEGRIEFVNRRWTEYTGLSADDTHLTARIPEVIHPDDLPGMIDAWTRSAAAGVEFDYQHRVRRASDGKYRWFLARSVPVRDDRGRVVHWFGTSTDIEDQKRTEDALRDSQARLELAQEAGRSGIFDWQIDEGRIVWNEPLERLYGLAPGAFEGSLSDWQTRVDPEDLPIVLEILQGAMRRADEGCDYEFRARLPDGSSRWLQGRAYFFYDGQGRPVRMVGVNIDISDRKRLEGTLGRQAAGLARQNERQKLLLEAATILLSTDEPDAMMRGLFARIAPHFDLDAYFNFLVNDRGDALTMISCAGIDEESARSIARLEFGQAICGNVAQRKSPIVATHIQQSDEPMARVVKSFGLRSYACNPLMVGDTLLGTLSFASRTRDEFEPDELEFLRTICHYVTSAYERLRLVGQLREADRRKDEFLATLAHELRNPLAPIRNALHLMGRPDVDGSNHEHERAMAERQVVHLTRLVDDLMDVARISRGKIDLRKQEVELAPIVAHAVASARAAIEARGQGLSLALPAEAILLEADPTRLEQILDNLLSNASKYTDRDGAISLRAERRGGEVVIRVADTGIGIDPPMLPRVFELFTQVDPRSPRTQGGLGIGLGLVKNLVTLHSGSITAHSDGLGRGTTFTVRLPALTPASPATPAPAPAPAVRAAAPAPPTRLRVMVVDDNEDAANSLARLLAKIHGHEVRVAYDGPSALAAATDFRPDVAILDIGMPGMDGREVARRLRARPEHRRILLVALTGWGQEHDRQGSYEAGFDRHLVKPVDPDALPEILATTRPAFGP